ncbi:MAG: ANTAR domain-containing protein [Actinobacteria bacterium]|nr:ANTAR domain-containing protein [Actinomycetota bacterium]
MPITLDQLRRNTQLGELLDRILERVAADLPEALGLAVSAGDGSGVHVLAHRGIENGVIAAQVRCGGPVPDAVRHQLPVISLAVTRDDRWPALGAAAIADAGVADVHPVVGAAAVPGSWGDETTVVLSSTLSGPADATTVTTLIGYEQLVASALVAATATTAIDQALAIVQSRGCIEQAKGAVMGQLGCDADTAWKTLRDTSQRANLKVRALAVALIEHIGGVPADQPASGSRIVPDGHARITAAQLWRALREAPDESVPHRR